MTDPSLPPRPAARLGGAVAAPRVLAAGLALGLGGLLAAGWFYGHGDVVGALSVALVVAASLLLVAIGVSGGDGT